MANTPKASKIQAISFDLDDTLWPILPVIEHAERSMYDWLVVNYPRIGDNFSYEEMQSFKQQVVLNNPQLQHDMTAMRKKMLDLAAFQSGYGARLIEPAFRVFYEARNQVTFFDDVLPVLEQLTANEQLRLGAITNGNANLTLTGCEPFFECCVSAEQAGIAKPAPEIFLDFADRMQINPKHILHVGDHPIADVAGAEAVGMQTVWLNRDQKEWPSHAGVTPNYTIVSLAQLPELVC